MMLLYIRCGVEKYGFVCYVTSAGKMRGKHDVVLLAICKGLASSLCIGLFGYQYFLPGCIFFSSPIFVEGYNEEGVIRYCMNENTPG